MQPVTTCAKGAVEAGPGATPWSRERWWRDEAHRPLSRLLLSGGEDVRGTEALEVSQMMNGKTSPFCSSRGAKSCC
jgi:hypothetical protein